MSGCYGNSVEDRYAEGLLNKHLRQYDEADKLENQIEMRMSQALEDETIFQTYEDDYEVIDTAQLIRALRNLDRACRGQQVAQDAVFSALSQIQARLKSAIEHEISQSEGEWDE